MAESMADQGGPRYQELQESVHKLHQLLEDPQFGCFTWHQFVDERIKEIDHIYFDKNFEEGKMPDYPPETRKAISNMEREWHQSRALALEKMSCPRK